MNQYPHPYPWREAGFDDNFATYCTCTGWTLADVSAVLCADTISDSPIDWCYAGLDPIEVHAAIRDGFAAPPQPSARGRHQGGRR